MRAPIPTCYFMGVQAGTTAGHYCRPYEGEPTPWSDGIGPLREWYPDWDGRTPALKAHYSAKYGQSRAEGEFAHLIEQGWTLISARDESGDARPGSVAVFAFKGEWTGEEALAFACRRWPRVIERIEQHLHKQGLKLTTRPARPAPAA